MGEIDLGEGERDREDRARSRVGFILFIIQRSDLMRCSDGGS